MNHHSTWKIIAKNTFTLFNLVNLVLALMVASVGSYKNMLFIVIAIANTLISIVNGIRAQKIVDKMRLVSEQRPTILRNGKPYQVDPEKVQPGDITILSLGDQIMFDSVVQSGLVEVNEAFITGEQDNIEKHPGEHLTSGSFVVSGTAEAKVERVGADNFVNKLQKEATTIKTADSKLFKLMNNIVKYISYALIPIGALLLWSRLSTEESTTTAVTSTVAALINMIPEGLILLTSSILALATIRLSKKQVLVQDLYAIETLARVDTICLDKTGTLTTGNMAVKDAITPDGVVIDPKNPTTGEEKLFLRALASILSHQTSENATAKALQQTFLKSAKFDEIKGITEVIGFSSDRKCSGIKTKSATYLLGAIEFVTNDKKLLALERKLGENYRVLAVVKKTPEKGVVDNAFSGSISRFSSPETYIPDGPDRFARQGGSAGGPAYDVEGEKVRSQKGMSARTPFSDTLLGLIRLEDEIRPTASSIIDYFYANDIAVKIISGDDLASVQTIARATGVRDLTGVDLSTLKTKNYAKLVKEYSIFTRVTPTEKKQLILALKKQGSTVAMTGDGVNDILAMKEADASIAIGEGSDAARRTAKFVLLDSGFEAVPAIIDEGRQSINNLERSTSLFLAKTIYASILAVIFVILPFSYPFSPIEMSLLNFACIGFPGLILALEHNTERIKNRFTTNILEYSVPIGLTVSACMLALSVISHFQHFSHFELTTTSVFITFAIDLFLIYWISRPLNKLRSALLLSVIGIMAAAFFIPFIREFFEFTFLTTDGILITLAIIAGGFLIFTILRLSLRRLSQKIVKQI